MGWHMTRTRWILLVATVAALGVGMIAGARWFSGPRPPGTVGEAPGEGATSGPGPSVPTPPGASAPVQPADQPFLEIEGTNLAGTDPSGRRVWDLRAKTLAVDNSRRIITLTAVRGQFYRQGKPEVLFTAPSAVFDVGTRDVELSGGVVARTKDGRILRAARVRWIGATRALEASGTVTLTQPGMRIRADTVTADAALDQTRFSGNIVVQVTE